MRLVPQANTISLKSRKVGLLGTSALVCLALAAPVMADDFVITSGSDTNGQLGDGDINGGHTVSLGIALKTTGTNVGIKTTNNDTIAQKNTITVSETGSITTGTGSTAYGIFNWGSFNKTTVSGSITTEGTYADGISNWFCPAYVPVSQLIYAALRSKAKGLFPPSDECRRLGL